MIDEVNLQRLADDLYIRTGIRIEKNKLAFLERRVEKRMQELQIDRVVDYYRHLHFNGNSPEWEAFVNSCTVNETYFFREFPHLQCFAEDLIPPLCEQREAEGRRNLRIWSAGCSTGEEPYTLGIILREMLDDAERWKIDLLATDIDTQVLQTARRGIYSPRSVHDVPEEYLSRYFTRRSDSYFIGLDIKRMVSFLQLNLMDREATSSFRDLDFIFCRNVLIYFDEASRKDVVDMFYDALNPGGYIFLGHSESIGRITNAFKLRRVGPHLIYQKP